ncbi:hypothetical protein B0H16DRAFT_1500958 [Mycena metata]|uniref:Uncharacterized protein n=1 Tax=Mycena metata TaxID=1033252 RepID=A0AAD7KAI5_9AGAR|nr:hypothetical protein B0H16DRAFT_1500958 [Mycena metata]
MPFVPASISWHFQACIVVARRPMLVVQYVRPCSSCAGFALLFVCRVPGGVRSSSYFLLYPFLCTPPRLVPRGSFSASCVNISSRYSRRSHTFSSLARLRRCPPFTSTLGCARASSIFPPTTVSTSSPSSSSDNLHSPLHPPWITPVRHDTVQGPSCGGYSLRGVGAIRLRYAQAGLVLPARVPPPLPPSSTLNLRSAQALQMPSTPPRRKRPRPLGPPRADLSLRSAPR